ncbi:MarR family winged helix-turn-helix transcriptional regulator [Streptomyces fuscigenes]|uniref:MarR family winged helix-turn-helix transcriptional regulator n=1 Tax=Streptomyces fuscigenes TaxID=1528880 RepID=UPI001F22C5A8|nr:MarR family transcriptional regulator [Streptomyces fuscigenes]MCF3963710.1 MarR family transcriptional regulator [Streptomyces fuscigenes]
MNDDAPWLDAEEFAAWHALVRTVNALPEALDRQLKRDFGLPHTEYLLMAMLSEAEDRTLSMTRLARRLRFSASRLSRIVTKLEDLGRVTRHRDPANGRVTLATLTDDGLALLRSAAPGHVRQVRAVLFDQLDREQVGQLRAIFEAVLAGPEMSTCCPGRTGGVPAR